MVKYIIVLLGCLGYLHLALSHQVHIEKSFTESARVLLENEVDGVEEFISSHPLLSQLSDFDLTEHSNNRRKLISEMIKSDQIEYTALHKDIEYNLLLKRKQLHDEKGLPHFIYHPNEVIDATNNPFGRKLSDEMSVQYHHVDCIYSGHLEGKPDHKAVFSFCNEEIRGMVDLPEVEDQVHFQPAKINNKRVLASWNLNSIIETERTCGNDDSHEVDHNVAASTAENLASSSSSRLQASSRIDVFMVNDNARTERYTVFGIFSQTLFIFSLVDTLYSGFPEGDNIEIVPTGILSMAFRDAWSQDIPDPNEPSVRVDSGGGLLDNFGTFMNFVAPNLQSPSGDVVEFDVAHLLSGEDFVNAAGNQGVVGLANLGTVCGGPDRAIGTTQDLFIDANTATVVAHEIGHNLGFEHTDQPIGDGSTCNEENLRRIMDSSGTTAQSWSTCSAFWWDVKLSQNPSCVTTSGGFVPVNGPYCGNGIVEEGEECDCGADDCSISGQISSPLDPCCNGATCRYNGGQCAANDPCCDLETCSFASNETECRPKRDSSNCDTAEFCTGNSGSCPTDILANFGSSCSISGFDGRCYRGSCVSAGLQCNDVGLGESCSNSGSGNSFCQATSGSGIRCLGSNSNCLTGTSFPQISPSDGTECDNGRGCYLGTCVEYSEIPLLDVCFNFEQDEGETDIDCGGDLCLPCTAGKICLGNSDCFSEVCELASEEGNTSICIGDEVIIEDDIFDVIGRFLSDNPGLAALIYLGITGIVAYFFYQDYKERKAKKEKRKEIGSIRQETYRNSLRHSQMATALRPLSTGSRPASSGFSAIEIPELGFTGSNHSSGVRSSIPEEDLVNATDNPRYSGGRRSAASRGSRQRNNATGNRNRTSPRPKSNEVPIAETVPPVTTLENLPEFDDEIEDKI